MVAVHDCLVIRAMRRTAGCPVIPLGLFCLFAKSVGQTKLLVF